MKTNIFFHKFTGLMDRIFPTFARLALFIVFFWFGFLKLIGESPASPLVNELLQKTLPFISFEQFIVFFGFFEMVIGLCFLIPKFNRIAFLLFIFHMGMTMLPLLLLPKEIWSGFFIPTLEGQYIIKNIVLVALATGLAARGKKS
jgi:uncharacterized membrane protein YkgB